jgi:acyl-CoA dehydrogenase
VSWEFETEPELQSELEWARTLMANDVEPLDYVLGNPYDHADPKGRALVTDLQQQVKDRGLWACHLEPELGGRGYGQVKLALLNEIVGRTKWGPTIFGCQAPDSGNAEILARFGTPEQKDRYLRPLLAGEVASCYSMTEPTAGADPTLFTTRAERDGDHWVITGEKWFSSNARYAEFIIVMALTDPSAGPHKGMSMFVLPRDAQGLEIVRNTGVGLDRDGTGTHSYLRYRDVRVPATALLGAEGDAFVIAQTRLAGGRVHHAMRTVGQAQHALDMMCERALSRRTRHGTLADLQLTQDAVADSWIELEQFRLLVLRTAWLIDKWNDYKRVRHHIAAVKALMPEVYHNIVRRAMHLHGSLGVSDEMPFREMLLRSEELGLADGPTEVHKLTLAREVLKGYTPTADEFPTEHIPRRRAAARARYADVLEHAVAEL